MGNIFSLFASGFVSAIGKLFGSPLEFLSGKSCSSVCGSTWDFICYIENFCIANLLKMGMILVLSYFVLLFLYMLHKIGICECICRGFCRIIWTCLASYVNAWEYCCTFMWMKLGRLKRTKKQYYRRRDLEEDIDSIGGAKQWHGSLSPSSNVSEHFELRSSRRVSHRLRRNYRGFQMRKALRPKSHRIRVTSGKELVHGKHRRNCNEPGNHFHDFEVHGSSKFVHKERKYRGGKQRWQQLVGTRNVSLCLKCFENV